MGLNQKRGAIAGAILLAAGSGNRLKSKVRKAWVSLGDKPLFAWPLGALVRSPWVGEIVLVAHPADLARFRTWLGRQRLSRAVGVVAGGGERQDSVGLGLRAFKQSWKLCLVQDAARPFLKQSLIQSCLKLAGEKGCAIAAVPVKDSIKQLLNGRVRSLPRESLWAAQTPQVSRMDWLGEAHTWAEKHAKIFTDEAGLLEAKGRKIYLAPAYSENIKVTTPEDLPLARQIIGRFSFSS